MTFKPQIQKFISFLLLVVFTVSILPQRFFHDVIATHTDAPECSIPSPKTDCLHQQGFHCSFNDLVVATPYVWVAADFSVRQLHFPSPVTDSYYNVFFTRYFFDAEGRGPPAV